MASKERSLRREKVGTVVSNKMTKTISVAVERLIKHDRYKKYIKRSSVFKAHDEKQEAKVGDKVLIFETSPMSKTKNWKLGKVLERPDLAAE